VLGLSLVKCQKKFNAYESGQFYSSFSDVDIFVDRIGVSQLPPMISNENQLQEDLDRWFSNRRGAYRFGEYGEALMIIDLAKGYSSRCMD